MNWSRIGAFIRLEQERRLERGVDVNGQSFKPYSKNTPKKGRVNLKDTGKMRSQVQIKPIKDGVQMSVVGSRRKVALAHQNGTNDLPQRKWFGLSKGTLDTVKDMVAKLVAEEYK